MAALRFLSKSDFFKKPIVIFTNTVKLVEKNPAVFKNVIRNMGHGRTMEVTASKFEWTKFKDHLHFYFMLGLVPIGLIIGGTNLFYGPAELKDIPEGYEPKHWEYYKHPISQFIARYLLESPEKRYEKHLHFVSKEQDKWIMKKLEKKVTELTESPSLTAYRYYYYVPKPDRYVKIAREGEEDAERTKGM